MSYSSYTVAYMVKRLNVQYFLPAIQRDFVWDEGRIISLFDSVMKNYPISSFLFWQLEYENRDKWGIYKFIENATKKMTHSELANLEGVREPILIIDGQQRLTSFLIGLKGTYTTKIARMRYDNPDAWEKKKLYLNLLQDPNIEANDDLVSPSYGFKFFKDPPPNSMNEYWFKVGTILDLENETRFISFKQNIKKEIVESISEEQKNLLEKNLDLLYSSIWRNQVVNFYLETSQDYDRALDIFVRANERGEPLKTSDLLLSIMTSKWKTINAKDEVNNFVEYINSSLTHHNYFIKDNIMKTCLVLTDLPVAYKVQNYTEENLSKMEANWVKLKDSVTRSIKCVNSFGVDGHNLTAKNALIPIFYYFYLNPELTLMTGKPFDVKNASAIRLWLIAALVNNSFGGSSDGLLSAIRNALRDAGSKDFPFEKINEKIKDSGRLGGFTEDTLTRIVEISYGSKDDFLALSLLYDDNNWGDKKINIDHIFPSSMFNIIEMTNNGFGDKWYAYSKLCNRLPNLELLTEPENKEKLAKPFDKWITTRDPSFLKRHHIPDNPDLWKFENFPLFIEERQKLIANRILK